MGCLQSSGGDSSSRNKNKNTADKAKLGPKSEDKKDDAGESEQPTVTNEGVDKTNPQNRQEDTEIRARKSKQPIVAASEPVDETNPQKTLEGYDIKARKCTFAELAAAAGNFRIRNLLGEGGFGKVYKGRLADCDQIVAIKRMDPQGNQGREEFLTEVMTLSMCDHPNLVKLIGYCADGDERLLVYEYMPLGSLDNHLYGERPNRKHLDWNIRMKIAAGIACGIEYLHEQLKPSIIFRDLKTSNILLDQEFHVKLSDFGLAKVGPLGDKSHVSTRVMGTYGYCAPDYAMTGQLTKKSDIYSFGVVLLELITGRQAIDMAKPEPERNLVSWARPLFTNKKNFTHMVDPALNGQYPWRGLYRALAVSKMCTEYQESARPLIASVVSAVGYIASENYDPQSHPAQSPRKASHEAGPSGVKNVDQGKG